MENLEFVVGPMPIQTVLAELARRRLWVVIEDTPEFRSFVEIACEDMRINKQSDESAREVIEYLIKSKEEFPFMGYSSWIGICGWKTGKIKIFAIRAKDIVDFDKIAAAAALLLEVM